MIFLFAALIALAPPKSALLPDAEWICVAYEEGRTCRPFAAVREFIIEAGVRQDDNP